MEITSEFWNRFVWFSQQSYFNPILNLINIIVISLTAIAAFMSIKEASWANELKLLPMLAFISGVRD